MRRPNPPTPLKLQSHLQSKPQAQKPEFSQRSGRQNFTLEGMSVRHLPNRTRRTQGIALVIVLLSAMILMVSLLAISATMTISSQRTTADQGVTLQAQYTAEAGVARATAGLAEAYRLMGQVNITNSTRTQIEDHAKRYCNVSRLNTLPLSLPTNFELCTVPRTLGAESSNRYSIFTGYSLTGTNTYPGGLSATQFWNSVFSKTPVVTKIAAEGTNGDGSWYTLTYGITPTRVLLVARNFYRFEFAVAPIEATGEVKVGNSVVAARKIQQQTGGVYSFDIQLPSYARNHVFRFETTDTSGSPLSFAGGETFNGPVHTNERPNFSKNFNGETPVFNSDFTSCAPTGNYIGYSGSVSNYTSSDMKSTFQGSTPIYSLRPCPELPTNSNNQKRASFGGDASNTAPVTDLELFNQFRPPLSSSNKPDAYNGVYYSQGNYAERNKASSWVGGMYVRGDVDQLKLCTNANGGANKGLQIIGVKQGNTTTTFQENKNGTWSVRVKSNGTTDCNASPSSTTNGSEVRELGGEFNGMIYVEGDISDMRGDNSTAPDIALKSKLMVTGTGKIVIKDSLTYTKPPTENDKNVANVLGIYSSGEKCEPAASSSAGCGSVLVDGPPNQDLDIHASIMATKNIGLGARKGEGFGSVRYNDDLGKVDGRKVQINLLGGIIERQSQTVLTPRGGYNRNYNYDLRFGEGYAPPFFPEQAEGGDSAVIAKWTTSVPTSFGTQQGVWQTVSK